MNIPARAQARKLSILPLIAATFFMVSGGPYGLEELIQKIGFGRSLLILFITPFIWSFPTALMLGELSSAIPEEGGFYIWVTRALGPFWGFQEAWLSLAASIFDMAIYPTLFVLYLGRLWPWANQSWHGVAIGATLIALCAGWNMFGSRVVGESSIALGVALLSPFAIMAIAGLIKAVPVSHRASHAGGGDLLGAIVICMWNYMGWDNASTIAGEVEEPQKTYPRMIIGAVSLVMFCYVVTAGAAWVSGVDPSAWETGSWVDAGAAIAGPALGLALTIGGMICGAGMLNALMMSYSRVPFVMAQDGFLPKAFMRTLANGAPWVALLACSVAWAISLGLSFERLVLIDVLLYGLSLLLEFVALIALRLREPNMPRPFRVPGGMLVASLLGVGPALLLSVALWRNRAEQLAGVSGIYFTLAVMLLGPVVYLVARRSRERSSLGAGPSH